MTPAANIRLPRPPRSVTLQSAPAPEPSSPPIAEDLLQAARDEARSELAGRRRDLELAAQALTRARHELEDLRDQLRQQAEANLLDLALEIARKVVMQEIRSGRCEIEPILHQALAHVAPGAEVEVRLNPDDLACLRQRQDAEEQRSTDQETQRQDAEEQGSREQEREEETLCASAPLRPLPTDLNLVADPAVGRGECMVRTAQGVIESRIDAHFDEIARALRE